LPVSFVRKQRVGLVISFIENCIFIFVPDHAGVRGKEQADRLAGTAVISDGCAMDHADVLHALREVGRVEDSLGNNESDTMERLRDGQVKLGAARYEHC
jgi:hypothetical protein